MKRTELKRRTPLRARGRLRQRRRNQVPKLTRDMLRGKNLDRCERCKRFCPRGTVHHKLMRSQGGTHELSNLAWLCPKCHDHVHGSNNRAESERDGWIIAAGVRG